MNTLERKLPCPIARKWAATSPHAKCAKAGIGPSAVRHWAQPTTPTSSIQNAAYTCGSTHPDLDLGKPATRRAASRKAAPTHTCGAKRPRTPHGTRRSGRILHVCRHPHTQTVTERIGWVGERDTRRAYYRNLPVQPLDKALLCRCPCSTRANRHPHWTPWRGQHPQYASLVATLAKIRIRQEGRVSKLP